jgi:crotonobetainyl-CoA:carnitine CoA-transferase CaiB-like acyl-CoA transferase
LENEDELERLVGERCKDFTRDELVERLIAGDVLTAPVNEVPEVVHDPQILNNRMLVTAQHSKLGPVTVTGVPIHFQGTPGSVRRASPLHGEHTEEVLAELGYSEGEVEGLFAGKAIGSPARPIRAKA